MGRSEILARLETAFTALSGVRGQLEGDTPDDTAWQLGVALAEILKAKRLIERDIENETPDAVRR